MQNLLLPFERRPVKFFLERREKIIHGRLCLRDAFEIRVRAVQIHKFVRIFPLAQLRHAKFQADGPCDFERAPRRILSGGVHVVAENDLVRIPFQKPRLLHRKRRPQRRDDIRHAVRMKGNGVHVPFHHDDLALLANLRKRLKQREKQTTLIENRRLRRIQILRIPVPHDAPAERHRFPAQIQNGKHAPVAEHIEITPVPLTTKPGCDQNFRRDIFLFCEIGEKPIPKGRRKA